MATAANFSRRGAAQLRAVQRAARGMAGAGGEGIKKIDGRIAHLFVFFFAPLSPLPSPAPQTSSPPPRRPSVAPSPSPSPTPLAPSPFSVFSARAFKRHLMKIKTFYRSALAKSSNNLYLLALFPHGGFIAPRLTLTTRTHALAHTSSPARIVAQRIKCHEHHARHYSPNIRGIPRGNVPPCFTQPIFIYEGRNAQRAKGDEPIPVRFT
jgi:hypothetical protein